MRLAAHAPVDDRGGVVRLPPTGRRAGGADRVTSRSPRQALRPCGGPRTIHEVPIPWTADGAGHSGPGHGPAPASRRRRSTVDTWSSDAAASVSSSTSWKRSPSWAPPWTVTVSWSISANVRSASSCSPTRRRVHSSSATTWSGSRRSTPRRRCSASSGTRSLGPVQVSSLRAAGKVSPSIGSLSVQVPAPVPSPRRWRRVSDGRRGGGPGSPGRSTRAVGGAHHGVGDGPAEVGEHEPGSDVQFGVTFDGGVHGRSLPGSRDPQPSPPSTSPVGPWMPRSGGRRSLRRPEDLGELRAERVEVVGPAARHERVGTAGADVDLLVHPGAPAFTMSVRRLGHEVRVRSRTRSASTRIHGAWQMTAAGFPSRNICWTKATAASSVRRRSAFATPPGSTMASKSAARGVTGDEVDGEPARPVEVAHQLHLPRLGGHQLRRGAAGPDVLPRTRNSASSMPSFDTTNATVIPGNSVPISTRPLCGGDCSEVVVDGRAPPGPSAASTSARKRYPPRLGSKTTLDVGMVRPDRRPDKPGPTAGGPTVVGAVWRDP